MVVEISLFSFLHLNGQTERDSVHVAGTVDLKWFIAQLSSYLAVSYSFRFMNIIFYPRSRCTFKPNTLRRRRVI